MQPPWYFFVGSHGGEKFNSALLYNRWVVELSSLYQSWNNRAMQMLKQILWYLEIRLCARANRRMRRICTLWRTHNILLGRYGGMVGNCMVFSSCHKKCEHNGSHTIANDIWVIPRSLTFESPRWHPACPVPPPAGRSEHNSSALMMVMKPKQGNQWPSPLPPLQNVSTKPHHSNQATKYQQETTCCA